MNHQELQRIRARHTASTQGEWYADRELWHIHDPNPVEVMGIRSGDDDKLICEIRYPRQSENANNVAFIVQAHQDIANLLDEVEQLRHALKPFAAVAHEVEAATDPKTLRLTIQDFRNARKILEENEVKNGR